MHNDQIHNLYSSPNVTIMIRLRRMRWVGHEACMGENILVGKPEGMRQMGKLWHTREDNIKIGFKESLCKDVD